MYSIKSLKNIAFFLIFLVLNFRSFSENRYARLFSVERGEGFSLLRIDGERPVAVLSGGKAAKLPKDAVVISPAKRCYVASTSAFDPLERIGAIDFAAFSSVKASSLFVEGARKRLEGGKMRFSGKYSSPDFEMLLSGGCDLAIENTMIFHRPEVRKMLEELGIPVVVEKSSLEKSPLARLEWVKAFGVLFGREAEAQEFFDEQIRILESAGIRELGVSSEESGVRKRVAFFYVSSAGTIVARRAGDFVSKMIGMAGGEYVPSGFRASGGNSSVRVQAEEFFALCHDADVLIYDQSLSPVSKMEELLSLCPMLSDFRAVKGGRVFFVGREFFQMTAGIVPFVSDVSEIVSGGDGGRVVFKMNR